jgi:hypothetical protein
VPTSPLASRKRWPFAALTVLCAAALVAALMGAGHPLSAAQFATTGHWVYNSVLGTVFHLDGATTNIDAQLPMDAEVGSQVLQGDRSGYVVGPSRITEFDKASLSQTDSVAPPADEVPLGIEVVGGPYAIYRNAGKIVRLGDPVATISAGGPVGSPVVTDDGTMWLHRSEAGLICTLAKDAAEISGCPVSAPKDHNGALTIVGGRPAFIDLFTSTLHTVDGGSFGHATPLGVSLSPNSRPAARDLDGKVAILDPVQRSLQLVDTRTQPAKWVTVALPPGDYDVPVSTGDVVALVDRQKGAVLTYGADGVRKDEKPIKQKTGQPRLSRGEDERVYVEDSDGTQVLVVDKGGEVRDVTVTGQPGTTTQVPSPPAAGQPTEVRVGQPTGPPPGPRNPVPDRRTQRPPVQDRPARNTPPPPVPASRPGAPPSVAAQAGNGSATVTWGAAADNRAPVTSYLVTWQGGSTTVGGGARRASINGLANGVRHVFTVTATNRVGAGPGASSNAVTPTSPVSPAAAPVSLRAAFDVDDRPSRDVTLTWRRPALNGGTLVHYVITATGRPQRTVTGTSTVYGQVEASDVVTFTVRAVTRTPDGQTLTGQPASATHRDTQ